MDFEQKFQSVLDKFLTKKWEGLSCVKDIVNIIFYYITHFNGDEAELGDWFVPLSLENQFHADINSLFTNYGIEPSYNVKCSLRTIVADLRSLKIHEGIMVCERNDGVHRCSIWLKKYGDKFFTVKGPVYELRQSVL